ncbi:hypothetical protein LVO79_13650 [Roseivivax marinus]|uniref:hypothetical protein n=1 Tax=Roseivivax marinus TaxID=1379903 RepID=UPI0004B0834D|nr:hypothetical protein [Roseivivax marinus]UMA64062.1 hypothetical protein LVO79_13650 [Roseivivax marinus]SEK35169.1 hypothetical protein SAMN05444413_101388 [Roseivivax marinus]
MSLGNIVRRAVSTYTRSKRRTTATPTRNRPVRRRTSAEGQALKGALRFAKKKL